MYDVDIMPLITTVKEKCKVCYTCVRECPAKAIRISSGQADVVPGRCIGCGNCVKVCRRNAKQYLSSIPNVKKILESNAKVAACLAPSFPAEFFDMDYKHLVGMIRALGFDFVNEVGFAADLVARKTMELFKDNPEQKYITTTCPAVVEYVKCYHPNLIEHLSPVVSPMVAMARVLKELHGKDLKIVFIGPCIAKKGEVSDYEIWGEVDEVLTFKELRLLMAESKVDRRIIASSEFDPPLSGKAALFPLSRGMTQSVDVFEDLLKEDIVSADGRSDFIDVIKEFESGDLDARLLELLCCKGCTMGAGMTSEEPQFRRRSRISKYVRHILKRRDKVVWEEEINKYETVNLERKFFSKDQRQKLPMEDDITVILHQMGKNSPVEELNCGACGYETCREHAIAIINGLAEVEMCLPYTIDKLHNTVKQLAVSNDQLASTREALNQSEKLASMGQLAAGIAHELNNPLGVVLMYANIILEDIDSKFPMFEDLNVIVSEAERCKKIVSDLLNFARKNKVVLIPTNVCEMIDQCVKITQLPEGMSFIVEHDLEDKYAEIDRDQIVQVLNNLISNGANAMTAPGKITLKTKGDAKKVQIIVSDQGSGISEKNLAKIFQPFFTTKQPGKGTGLGLAVTYGIIKMHRGDIKVVSNDDSEKGPTGTTFTITLPRKKEGS